MCFNMNVAVAFTFKDQLQTKLKNQQDALRKYFLCVGVYRG